MDHYRREYMKIARKLTLSEIQGGAEPDDLSLDDLITDGRVKQSSKYFMGVFSKAGLMYIVKAFGLAEDMKKQGLQNLKIEIDTSDPYTHRLYAYAGKICDNNKICEMVLKQGPMHFSSGFLSQFPNKTPNFLQVEWLLLQNPTKQFDKKRPPLPGQKHPGLGVGDQMMQLMIIMTRRLHLEGIINKPRYFHTAFMFTKEFIFTNPRNQAILMAINRDLLSKYNVHTVAWAAHFDCIINQVSGSELIWDPDFLILPLKKYLIKYFRSKDFHKEVALQAKKFKFSINTEKFLECAHKNKIKIYEKLG